MLGDEHNLDDAARQMLGAADHRLAALDHAVTHRVRTAFEQAAEDARVAVEQHMAAARTYCESRRLALGAHDRASARSWQTQRHQGRIATVHAFGTSLAAAQTSSYRLFVKRLRRAQARVSDALRHGQNAATNAVAEARVRWELHVSLAKVGQAPSPTREELDQTVKQACAAAIDAFAGATERLVDRVARQLRQALEHFSTDISAVSRALLDTLDPEIERTLARIDRPEVNIDMAVATVAVTMAGAGAAVTFGRDLRSDLVGSSALGGMAAALTALMGRMATNVGSEAPLLEGWRHTMLRALPGGIIAGAGGSWVAAPWFVQLLHAVTRRLDTIDRGPWGVVARGLLQTGEAVFAQASSRACVAAAIHGLATLEQQSLTQTPFDVVAYGTELGRHGLTFALGDARDWLELHHDAYQDTP